MKKWKKTVSLMLALCMTVSLAACGGGNTGSGGGSGAGGGSGSGSGGAGTSDATAAEGAGKYTFSCGLGSISTWSPTDWSQSYEAAVLGYTTTLFYNFEMNEAKDNYIIVPAAASAMPEDITASYAGNAVYGVPAGASMGYAWRVTLNDRLCWEDGTPITADDYLYTLEQQLSPEMKNYRASTFYDGLASLANARAYYDAGAAVYANMNANGIAMDALTAGDDGVYRDGDGNLAYMGWTVVDNYWLGGYALNAWASYFSEDVCALFDSKTNADGYIPLTDEVLAPLSAVIVDSWADDITAYCYVNRQSEAVGFDQVGIVKESDYSLVFVMSKPVSQLDFCQNMMIYLVKEDLYEANKKDTGGLVKSSYGTTAASYLSYGPYRIVSYQPDKEMVLTKNESWYGWTDDFYKDKFQTTDIDMQKIDDAATAFNLFLQGRMSSASLTGDQLTTYANSDYIYYTPGSFVCSLFLNTDLETLRAEDGNGVNHSILSIREFRKAMSLCLNRQDFSQYMYGYDPCVGLLNDVYLCSLESGVVYRKTEQAKKALCELYGVDNYSEITGYDPEEASALFQSAYDQAVEQGLMTAGDKVQIDFHAYGTDAVYQNQVNFLIASIQDACKGTDLEGKVTINLVADENYSGNMQAGVCDMILSSWGGSENDPYWMMLCYCTESFNLSYGYDVYSQMMTINVGGQDITMSAANWYDALHETTYALADMDTRNTIMAEMERQLLDYCAVIPLCSSNSATLYSQRIVMGSEEYVNSLVGYGGISVMGYTMDDAQWDSYCAGQNYQLTY